MMNVSFFKQTKLVALALFLLSLGALPSCGTTKNKIRPPQTVQISEAYTVHSVPRPSFSRNAFAPSRIILFFLIGITVILIIFVSEFPRRKKR